MEQLEKMYGTWEMPWGEINRYQRTNPGKMMDDQAPSWSVSQASSKWGSLPSFDSKRYDGTIKDTAIMEIALLLLFLLGKRLLQKQSSRVVKVDFQTQIILRTKPKDLLMVNLKPFIFIKRMF